MVDNVSDVGLELLRAWQVKGVVLDLDNTIVPWHTAQLTPEADAWARALRDGGVRLCLLTNNYGTQARTVAEHIGARLVRIAFKPVPAGFGRALALMQVERSAAVAIGDQLFTDVLGAKLAGIRAVLVRPLSTREFLTTKVMRWLERPLVARLRRGAPV